MSKSRKKKSTKKQVSGRTLGALALIISLGALGIGLYQLILAPSSEGPLIYVTQYDDIYYLDGISMVDYPPQLSVTYSVQPDDRVLLEFNCEISLDPIGYTEIGILFDINNTILPATRIRVYDDHNIATNGYMRYSYVSSTAGESTVTIWITIDDDGTNSYIRYSVLTVTVY
ncbi:MAG: hypothetical protein PVJ05_11965 [Candidatus Thorarchaeota archaeon]|jgi:hypothetical protein